MNILRTVALVGVSMLVGCQTAEPIIYKDVHTGGSVHYGTRVSFSDGLLNGITARPFFIPERGKWAIEIVYVGMGWAFIDSAWSFGKQYQYIVTSREIFGGCAGGCSIKEEGAVLLSEADFRRFATTGIEMRISGTGGSATGKIPAAAFAGALKATTVKVVR